MFADRFEAFTKRQLGHTDAVRERIVADVGQPGGQRDRTDVIRMLLPRGVALKEVVHLAFGIGILELYDQGSA